ncbi:glutathione S-transferase 1-like [Gigantopelta aegis]|uniref:glutathione S-transferase 1-like n=1 Tax=Gigantopelta aegis TaxID=1735272 RepID=UPI001B88818F|nr:glutathione S-transferase 1-like [Gigantopelta aegis]
MGKMKLYYWTGYRSVRCIWLIKELGVEEDFEFVKLKPNGPDKKALEDYAKNVHPHGTIPALQVEGRNPVVESGAICLFLANKYGRFGPDDDHVSDYYNWIVYTTSTLDATLAVLFSRWYLNSSVYDDATVEKTLDKWKASLDFLTKALADGRDFICGSKFTAADCVLGYSLAWAEFIKQQNLFAHHPVVVNYLKRLYSRSAFQEALKYE